MSFYFTPDLSAGSFRTAAFINELLKKIQNDTCIDIVSTLPNRYKTFCNEAPEYEKTGNMEIFRISLPSHKSGIFDQSKAFLKYFKEASKLTSGKKYDLIYATSSRLMTAFLAACIAKRQKAPLYLDIRDIFVDTIKDVVPKKAAIPIYKLFSYFERWTIKNASKINLVSGGFKDYFEYRYPEKTFSYYTNGIDDDFIDMRAELSASNNTNYPVKVLYAGNIGDGQGLHKIIPDLSKRMGNKMEFIIIGDGGKKELLQKVLKERQCDNVKLYPPVGRNELISEYHNADVLFLHLNNYPAFRKVLPSKIFEYAAVGKPIWAGVAGYSADFINSEIQNAVVFHPCNSKDAIEVLKLLEIKNNHRTEFISKYARSKIMAFMVDDVLSILN